jgi:hypothetical protein
MICMTATRVGGRNLLPSVDNRSSTERFVAAIATTEDSSMAARAAREGARLMTVRLSREINGIRANQKTVERVFFGGDEGAATTGLIDPATLAQAPLFNVGTTFADYDYGHHGFNLGHQRVLIEDPFRSGMPEMALHRIPSGESLVMQLGSSVAPSMSSSGYFSIRPESPSQQIAGVGDWADAAATTRSEYFFTQTPLRLVPRVRCCHTETESEDNSSATLFTDGSDFLVDGEDDDASE